MDRRDGAALADLDLVLLTSRNEGTPLALIEAGAAGRAWWRPTWAGVRSVVERGETGLLGRERLLRDVRAVYGELLG